MFCGAAVGLAACDRDPAGESGTPSAECEHTLMKIARQELTCVLEGARAHYECGKCGKMFFDEGAEIELSEENVTLAKIGHSLSHIAASGKVAEYWHCFACGKYFTDAAATAETTYRALYKDAFDPVRLEEGNGSSLNLFDQSSELSPLYDDFTLRYFMSWESADGAGLADFPVGETVQVNLNLNREITYTGTGWFNCGIGYRASGLFFKSFSGEINEVPAQFTQLFLEQGGIYAVVVREGGTVSLYFEDAEGVRHLICVSNQFGEDEAVVRLAANQASGADGWTAMVTQTAICVGVADEKCIFDKAYET